MKHARPLHVAVILAVCLAADATLAQERRHLSHQTVTPSFDGWFPNADGTFSLVFGYYNRNFEEEVDVPIGHANRVEPGPEDRGQPTRFLPRRQFGAFTVIVPKDFGAKSLKWTIVTHGTTLSVPGYLRPEWQINPFEESTTGDKPPLIKFDQVGRTGEGPGGLTTSLKAVVGTPATVSVWATARGGGSTESGPREVVSLVWSVFRAPGRVTMSDPRPKADAAGKATMAAVFNQPGEYVLRLLAGTADTTGCCWTNAFARVSVSAKQEPSKN